jgi:ribosomal protein S27AE
MGKHIAVQNVDMNIGDEMKFCPRCGSKEIGWPLPHDRQKWECKECGYVGAFIIDDGVIAEEIRKEYLKDNAKE